VKEDAGKLTPSTELKESDPNVTATLSAERIYQKEEFNPGGTDHSLAMARALTRCREEGTQVLVLPKETSHFPKGSKTRILSETR
jgi:hypothetical protein